jgi:hypothetical protein
MEFGAALLSYHCFKTPCIYIVGPHLDTNFAFYHPDVIRKATIEEVLAELQIDVNPFVPVSAKATPGCAEFSKD